MTLVIGVHNDQAIGITGTYWHGYKTIGEESVFLVIFPTNLYDGPMSNDLTCKPTGFRSTDTWVVTGKL